MSEIHLTHPRLHEMTSTADHYASGLTTGNALVATGATTFAWQQVDHVNLANIGVNTHAQLDTALTRLANTSGTNTGDQTLSGLGGVPTGRLLNTTAPLTGGGDLSVDRTLGLGITANLHVTSGNLDTIQGIQTSSSPTFAGITAGAAVATGSTFTVTNALCQTSRYGTSNPQWQFLRAEGTLSSPTAVTSGDALCNLQFQGYDGSAFRNAVQLVSYVDGAVSSGVVPGRLVLFVENSSGSNVEALRINSAANLLIGTTTDGMTAAGSIAIAKDLAHRGTKVGFYNTTPTAKPTVTGAKGGNAALGSLLTALAGLGLVTDSTSA